MNKKTKETQVKKSVLRNTSQRLPTKIKVNCNDRLTVSNSKNSNDNKRIAVSKLDTPRITNTPVSSLNSTDDIASLPAETVTKPVELDKPAFQSTLRFRDKINAFTKPGKCMDNLDMDKLMINEKITKKINFASGKSVFKNLIPLTTNEAKPQPVPRPKPPKYKPDEEPKLEDFMRPRKEKICYHIPSIPDDDILNAKFPEPTVPKGLYLTKIIQNYSHR